MHHAQRRSEPETENNMIIGALAMIYIFILAIFTGVEVISRVPTVLHTPLMSGANAIHGIVLIGGVILLVTAGDSAVLFTLGFIAVIFGALNVVGGGLFALFV